MNDKAFEEAIWSVDPSGLRDPSACVQGHASFDAKHGINLELPLGTLLDREPVNGVIVHGPEPLEADHVYGLSQTGSYLVISDVFQTHRSTSFSGFECQTLHGQELIVSKKPVYPCPLIASFAFGMVGLREWVGISPTRQSYVCGNDGGHVDEMSFKYVSADIPDVALRDRDGVRVTIDCVCTNKGGRIPQFEFGFVTDYEVIISFSEPLALEEALESWVFPVREFLAFCMGFYGSVSCMRFCTADGVRADYYAALAEGEEPTQRDLTCMPLHWHNCSSRLDSMLESWLGFEGFAKEAATRVVSLLADWRLPLELRFLATAQAFEAVTRIGADPYDLQPEEFERMKSAVISSVEESGVRRWVKRILGYANFKSAGALAKEHMLRLGEFAEYLVPDAKRFLDDHRQTRNYNTHLDATDKPHVLHGKDLLVHSDATYLLLYASICLLMGFEPNEVLDLMKKSRWKSSAVRESRRMYGLDK